MSNPTSPALRRAMLATLVLCMVGCKDLKIETQGDSDEFRFGQQNEMWLVYKKEVVSSGVQVVWSSDKQGELSREFRLDVSALRPGKHKITAKCIHDGKDAKKSKKIRILNDDPVASIQGPKSGASFGVGNTVTLQGSASDREDGVVPAGSLSWTLVGPNGQTDLGSGESVDVPNLDPGQYTIMLSATDRAGAAGSTRQSFEISNQAPTASISAPVAPVAAINVLDSLSVRGTATDPDPVTGSANVTDLRWTSNLHPGEVLATGPSATLSNLKGGTHEITLKGYDEFGKSGSASFNVVVSNQDPTVEILSPSSNSFFSAAATVTFEAQASDPEAAISPDDVVWSSNNGGRLGTGLTFRTDDLKAGEHTVTCTVTDAHGGTDMSSIVILVRNELPEPTILRPAPTGTHTFNYNDTVRLVGEATDEEDGTVADNGMVWSFKKLDGKNSGKTGNISRKGASVRVPAKRLVERAGFGSFEIKLTATDSDGGEQTSASRRFRIENQRPDVRLNQPAMNASYTSADAIALSANATDADSTGFLPNRYMSWSAKELATGVVTKIANNATLAAGRYQIILTVTDPQDEDVKVRATTTIVVTAAPATTPAAGAGSTGIAPAVGTGN